MFKFAKYYVIANIYKKTKVSIWVVLGSLATMPIVSLVFSDLAAMTGGEGIGLMIGLKWMIFFSLLAVTAFHLRKIFKSISLPFTDERVIVDEKKDRVMEKLTLRSRSDIILDKYRGAEWKRS